MDTEATDISFDKKLNNYNVKNFKDEAIFTGMKILFFIPLIFLAACSVSNNPLRKQVKMLQKGVIRDDTSYVYALPFEPGKKYRVIQGYFSRYTHKERAALDFNLKKGTNITAARDGVVTRVKEDGTLGGLKKKYRSHGNNIIIQHADGSRAGYWHLQHNGAVVKVGDSVKKGQVIGLSGKTGYAMIPHLHFLVWKFDNGQWQQVATRFETNKGIKYLRAWKKYQNNTPVSMAE